MYGFDNSPVDIDTSRRAKDWRWDRADAAKKGQLLTTPFDDEMRRMRDSYGAQCVLIAQLDFDIWGASKRNEWAVSVYSDRLPYQELRDINIKHGGMGAVYD